MSRAALCALGLVAIVVGCEPSDNAAYPSCVSSNFAAAIKAVAGELHDFYDCPTVNGPGPGSTSTNVQFCAQGEACTTVDACGALSSDTGCNACLKTECCSSVVAFVIDPVAPCLVACQMGGATMETCSGRCNAPPDNAYDALAGCVADHCATACAALRLQ